MLNKALIGALLVLLSSTAMAEIAIIVHPSNNDAIDAKVVQRIFLGKEKKFPSGAESVAVNQVGGSDVRQSFDSDILGRTSSQVSAHWSKLVFTGKGVPPKEVDNDAAVIELVSQNPSVIGYVHKASVTDAVKVISL
jgi:ABC-type phosphate transport system substrate-binding protein